MKRLALTCFEKQPIIQNNVIYDKLNELNMNLLLFLNEFTNIIFLFLISNMVNINRYN